MKRLMLLAVVALGCNYYGPDNLPPDDGDYGPDRPPPAPVIPPPPTYRYERFIATDVNGVAFAPCPPNSLMVAGGGDCVSCPTADPSAYVFGSIGFRTTGGVDGWITGCFPGCAAAQVVCLTSSVPGTITHAPLLDESDMEAVRAPYRAARAARGR